MKQLPLLITALAVSCLFANTTSYAQSKSGNNGLLPPPNSINIDGNIKEWGDSLRYYNEAKQINYSIANDKDNIYVAVRINDRSELHRLLMAGLTLSVDPKGRKHDTYSITFPYNDAKDMMMERLNNQSSNDQPNEDDHEQRMQAQLAKLKQLKVTGFKDVENEVITNSNNYGIHAAVGMDENGYLVYEAVVPISMFHVENPDKSEWAFNIKINGIQRPQSGSEASEMGGRQGGRGMGGGRGGMGGGHGGMGGGRMGGGRMGGNMGGLDHSEMSKSVDFWEKYYLSTASK